MDMTYFDPVNVQVGLFKSPMSAEDLQDSRWLHLMERSLLNNLIPERNVGIMFHGKPMMLVEYALAFVNAANGSGTDLDDEQGVVGRLMVTPFAKVDNDWINNLAIGGFGSWSRQEDVMASAHSGFAHKTSSGATFFQYNPAAVLDGDVIRYGANATWYAGPVSLMAEWMKLRQDVAVPSAGLPQRQFTTEACYVQIGVVVTGENASAEGVTPKNNFDPRNGKFGAVEIVGRYANINVEDDVLGETEEGECYAFGSDTADAWTIGLNWYLNSAVKAMVNYEHVDVKTIEDDEDTIMFRFQISF
jgi:phosphate-selective porin OprO/OprP